MFRVGEGALRSESYQRRGAVFVTTIGELRAWLAEEFPHNKIKLVTNRQEIGDRQTLASFVEEEEVLAVAKKEQDAKASSYNTKALVELPVLLDEDHHLQQIL